MDRIPQTEHHLYATKFETSHSSVERFLEYRWAAGFCEGLKVLDFGSNTGYGAELIALSAKEVVGIDVVDTAINVANETYHSNPKLSFVLVKEGELPFEDESFDCVVLLNIIEHFPDARHFLEMAHRILRPGGKLMVSTVNRNLRLYPWQQPWNRLHTTEFSPKSLNKLLLEVFGKLDTYGLHNVGSFFPDRVGNASKLKFDTGIKWPLQRVASQLKRRLLGQAPPESGVTTKSKPKTQAASSFTFEEACQDAVINQTNLAQCVKILCVATK
jgi:ubiquinone/menaquinone biosynthesis C-methylase UbiE